MENKNVDNSFQKLRQIKNPMIIKILTSSLMVLSIINIRFGFFSISDFILSFFLIYLIFFKHNVKLTRSFIVVFLIFISLYSISALSSGYSNLYDEILFYGFLYKYFFISAIFLIFTNIHIKETFLTKLVFTCWIVLSCWAIYYAFFFLGNPLLSVLVPNQISFPGTGSAESINPDSHLYAYLVGLLGLYLTIFSDGSKRLLFLIVTLFIILLTGSRNPLALYGIVFLLYFINSRVDKKILMLSGIIIFIPILASQFIFLENILPSMRSFQFDLLNDDSAGSRIKKLFIAIDEYMNYSLIFGQSVFGSSLIWTDGIHTIILVHFGIVGLILYLSILFYYFTKLYLIASKGNAQAKKIFYLSIYLFMGLFITEFILTSRGAILALVPLVVLINNLNNDSRVTIVD